VEFFAEFTLVKFLGVNLRLAGPSVNSDAYTELTYLDCFLLKRGIAIFKLYGLNLHIFLNFHFLLLLIFFKTYIFALHMRVVYVIPGTNLSVTFLIPDRVKPVVSSWPTVKLAICQVVNRNFILVTFSLLSRETRDIGFFLGLPHQKNSFRDFGIRIRF
jgi:hypothetical protein